LNSEIFTFFDLHRQIFGICPECTEFFRLSECQIFLKKKPKRDWMDNVENENSRLEEFEQETFDIEQDLRESGREKGRKLARLAVKKVDPIFTPRKLNPDDAKVIFQPIDYVVFNGLKNGSIKNIILLDREAKEQPHRRIQESIERVIDGKNYEWQTLRVNNSGEVKAD